MIIIRNNYDNRQILFCYYVKKNLQLCRFIS